MVACWASNLESPWTDPPLDAKDLPPGCGAAPRDMPDHRELHRLERLTTYDHEEVAQEGPVRLGLWGRVSNLGDYELTGRGDVLA